MIRLSKKKVDVVFFDSIEEMPHRRYMKFNKEMMRANEVGNTVADMMKRVDRAMSFIGAKEHDKAMKELSNAKMSYSYAQNQLEPKGLALAAMVKSVNGVEKNDITTSGLQDTLAFLQDIGITKKELDDTSGSIKKKLKESLKFSFLCNLRDKISSITKR